jgi:hypothetical protein
VTGHVAVAYHAVGGFRHDPLVVTDHAAEREVRPPRWSRVRSRYTAPSCANPDRSALEPASLY